jgi:hypothetical protein
LVENRALVLLRAARLVRTVHLTLTNAHLRLELGDQTGILDPATTEPLVEMIRKLLPEDVAGIAVGAGLSDVLLGYLLGKQLAVPVASIANQDGMVRVVGRLPDSGAVWLVISVLDEPATIAEFGAASSRSGAQAAGVVALVDRLSHPDPRVRALLHWSDYSHQPDKCPVCTGSGG